MTRSTFATAALLATIASSAAQAGPLLATLNATYDSYLNNTVFSIDNLSTTDELTVTLLTNVGPTTSVQVGDIDPGTIYQYSFNQVNGGYLINPQSAGTLDTTLYELEVVDNGVTFLSGWFSAISNLTGAYVDFLGNTCYGEANGCGVAQSGVVAEIPEPATTALFGLSIAGLVALRRRRAV